MPEPQEKVSGIPPAVLDLPLEKIDIKAQVNGLWADVHVVQVFGNKSQKPSLEAVYVFPLVEEAMVLGVEMQIGKKRVVSELRKREEARAEYERARDAGHHASLMEQERPNIFTMSVAGIEPGDEIVVTTHYLAPVPWQADGGRLNFPTVVGPQFIPGKALEKTSSGGGWAPDTDEVPDASKITPKVVEDVNYKVNLDVELKPGFACRIASPSHDGIINAIDLKYNETHTIIANDLRPDRNIVITYQTKAVQPQVTVGLSRFKTDKDVEDFVVVQLTPQVKARSNEEVHVLLLLDDSGSMAGAKVEGLKVIARRLITRLQEETRKVRAAVVAFGDQDYFRVLADFGSIGDQYFEAVKGLQAASGGTYLGQALTRCMEMFKDDQKPAEHCIIVISDGESEDKKYVKKPGVRVHTVGIGSAVNDATLKQFASQTGGMSEFVLSGEDYSEVAGRIAALASGPVVRNISFEGLPQDAEVVGVGDLFANRPTTVVIKFKSLPQKFEIIGRGVDGAQHEWKITIPEKPDMEAGSQLWAKMKLRDTQDAKVQTDLSLRYGIVSSYTAFVAVMEKTTPSGKPERVDIAVDMPHGWEYEGVFGGGVPSVGGGAFRLASLGGATRGGGLVFRGAGPTLGGSGRRSAGGVSKRVAVQPSCLPTDKAPELLKEAEKIFAAAKDYFSEAEEMWKKFVPELQSTDFGNWSEFDKARLYFVLVELKSYCCHVEIPDELKKKPTDVDAYNLWVRAERGLGKAVS